MRVWVDVWCGVEWCGDDRVKGGGWNDVWFEVLGVGCTWDDVKPRWAVKLKFAGGVVRSIEQPCLPCPLNTSLEAAWKKY